MELLRMEIGTGLVLSKKKTEVPLFVDSVALGIRAVYYHDDTDAGPSHSQGAHLLIVSAEMGRSFFPTTDDTAA